MQRLGLLTDRDPEAEKVVDYVLRKLEKGLSPSKIARRIKLVSIAEKTSRNVREVLAEHLRSTGSHGHIVGFWLSLGALAVATMGSFAGYALQRSLRTSYETLARLRRIVPAAAMRLDREGRERLIERIERACERLLESSRLIASTLPNHFPRKRIERIAKLAGLHRLAALANNVRDLREQLVAAVRTVDLIEQEITGYRIRI